MPLSVLDFARLFDASPNAYLVLDRRLYIVHANPAYLQSTGRELADIVGRWAWDAFPTDPDTLKQSVASFERVIATRQADTMALLKFDIARADADGGFEERWWSIIHSPVFDDEGEVAYVLQHPIDVTELQRARQAAEEAPFRPAHHGIIDRAALAHEQNLLLKADSQRLRAVFEQAPGFIAILSGPDFRFEFVNEAYERSFGRRGFVGKTVREAFPDLQSQPFFDLLERAYSTGERHVARAQPIRLQPDPAEEASEHFLDFVYEPIRDEVGQVRGIFVEGYDVTERIQAERRRDALLRLDDCFRDVDDPAELAFASAKVLGEALGACRVGYGALDPQAGTITVGRTWSLPGLPDVAGVHAFADYGDHIEELRRGQVAAVADLETDARTADRAAALRALGVRAFLDVPIVEDGQTVADFFVHASAPRAWTEDDIAFVREVAERTRAAIARRTAEAALKESEERLRLIVDGARDYAILTTDPERRITSWSAGAESAFWWTADEALGRSADDLFTPEDRAARQPEQEFGTAAERGCAPDQRWHQRADGSSVYIDGSTHSLPPDEQGRPRGFLKIGRDETERRRRDDELLATRLDLEKSEERFRTALEIETVGAIYFDMRGVLVDANDAFLAMSGHTREELERGKISWQSLTPPEWLAVSDRAFAELKATGRTTPYEKEYLRKDGSRFWGLFAAKLLPDDTGFEFVLDISDRKQAEARLRELNETLEQRVADEVAERSRAEDALRQSQKMEAIGQLTGGVAHDFNNLLTVIRSSADLLRRRELPEEKRRRYIDAISDTADRAAKLTRQLLAFARRQALRSEVFDAAARVDDIADMLRTVLGARVELVIDARCRPCPVEADAGQFETALVNMAVNARDAMDGEGRLTIGIEEAIELPAVRGHAGSPGDFVVISVVDTGAGIAPDLLQRIFEPFFTTKEVGKGTGLGLSQVFGFAKQSGGEVAVESEPGRGTTFALYLPKVHGVLTGDAEGATMTLPSGRGRVLVVEDNATVGEFAANLLHDIGYTTELAGNAAEAIEHLETSMCAGGFDIVFSDVVMPGMGGVEFGRIVRERWPGLPVVLTSGYSHVLASDARHGFPVLHKPYSVEELSRVLRQATWGKRPVHPGQPD